MVHQQTPSNTIIHPHQQNNLDNDFFRGKFVNLVLWLFVGDGDDDDVAAAAFVVGSFSSFRHCFCNKLTVSSILLTFLVRGFLFVAVVC